MRSEPLRTQIIEFSNGMLYLIFTFLLFSQEIIFFFFAFLIIYVFPWELLLRALLILLFSSNWLPLFSFMIKPDSAQSSYAS